MLGLLGDFFRFWWASFYWNTRKGWFRLRGAHRDDCPCQNPSDSGLAGDTRCNAIIHWHEPERFRRICPLLVNTEEGLRCSVEAEGVRPFWGRTLAATGALAVVLYLSGTAAVYFTLRTSGYQLGYSSILWPQNWGDLRSAREQLYTHRAKIALELDDFPTAIASLQTVCQLNPQNYRAGLTLARLSQLARLPNISGHVYERLMVDVPEERVQTARLWFRSLLAHGDYAKIIPLAAMMLSEDPEQRAEWLQALLFAARRGHDAAALVEVLHQNPHFPEWCTELINVESAILQERFSSVLPRLTQPVEPLRHPYVARYQFDTLLARNELDAAQSLLAAYADELPKNSLHLWQLRLLHRKGAITSADHRFAETMQRALDRPALEGIAAWMVTQPSPSHVQAFHAKLSSGNLPLTDETLPLYHAVFLAAKLSRAPEIAARIEAQLRAANAKTHQNLETLAQLLAAPKSADGLTQVLPLVPLPTEVVYALVEKQSTDTTP